MYKSSGILNKASQLLLLYRHYLCPYRLYQYLLSLLYQVHMQLVTELVIM